MSPPQEAEARLYLAIEERIRCADEHRPAEICETATNLVHIAMGRLSGAYHMEVAAARAEGARAECARLLALAAEAPTLSAPKAGGHA